ncbi:hypothetical protein SAMN02982989_3361 [Xaviernesmea oryzae]|uniref:Uncharacterized protein n=1 Tax=Xaviernesmea oryzae TaxID=464029 RepID=A0A1X7G7P7_9HYPH|nr:hypothetical protein [Xaviernesmea oryzae]SMF65460.1 hypothetical protein SAMN02982989_3361 [Xaviernesmea oryzae]
MASTENPSPQTSMTGGPRCPVVGWPPLKKAIWDQLIAANINSGKYLSAWELTDSIYAAALVATKEADREA